jgi:transcriptional regulator with XRE-family HTH domain
MFFAMSTPKSEYFYFFLYFLANMVYNVFINKEVIPVTEMGNKEVFAKNLAKYLNRFGKSQREMVDIVGVSYSTFNEWVNAKKYPRIDKIEFLANYFGILKSDLIEDDKNLAPGESDLTENEIVMLDLFRQIPEDQQPVVLAMIRAALGTGK